jgi:hypothetical protein
MQLRRRIVVRRSLLNDVDTSELNLRLRAMLYYNLHWFGRFERSAVFLAHVWAQVESRKKAVGIY